MKSPAVILLPGLWMPAAAMWPLALRLRAAGFGTALCGYPSMRAGLEENARRLARCVKRTEAAELHLVGHSLGGIVIVALLQSDVDSRLRRAVLLGPPFGGSFAARALARSALGRALLGRGIREWLAAPHTGVAGRVELGVIAGSRAIGAAALAIRGMPAPGDGVVTVQETRVPGMRDHLVLPVGHTGMLLSRAVADATGEFLRSGAFARTPG